MSFPETVVQGEAIESDSENEINGDAKRKVNYYTIISIKIFIDFFCKLLNCSESEWQRSDHIRWRGA